MTTIISDSLKGGIFEAEYRLITERHERRVFARGFCTLDKSNRPERFPGVVIDLSDKLH